MKNVKKSYGKFSNNKTRIQINHETGCSLRGFVHKKKNKTLQNRWRDTDPGYDNHISESFSPLVAIQNVPMQFVLVTLHRIVTIVRTSTTLRWPHSPLFKLKPFSLAPTHFSCDVIGGVSLFNNTNYVFEIISKNIKSVKE